MTVNKQLKIAVIVLNWNGRDDTLACIDALKKQTQKHTLIIVDNASTDGLIETLQATHPHLLYKDSPCTVGDVVLLQNSKNLGFAGGVNTGIRHALKNNFDYIALINNDATPEPTWLENLVAAQNTQNSNNKIGVTAGKLLKTDGTIDSTGDQYTIWGLAYPRGRGEKDQGQYDNEEEVFAATGGASLYNCQMLREIGLFDEDFFAYYEDVDLSFRARLAGWKIVYAPKAVAHHKIGATSGKIPGFTTYMTIKNLPMLFWKNVPLALLPKMLPRFTIAYSSIVLSSLAQGKIIPTAKGLAVSLFLSPKKLYQRIKIQSARAVTPSEISKLLTYDLPPNATKLKKLRKALHINH
jgi:GT2 family glycosyltransferase